MDDRVRPHHDGLVDVGRGGILDRHSRGHQLGVLLLSHDAAHFRELLTAVDAAKLIGVVESQGVDDTPVLAVEADQIGQIVLVLHVVGANRANRLEQAFEFERVNPGIDFTNLALGRAGVPILHDACNLPAGPDDAAVAAGLVDDGGHDGCGRAGRTVPIHKSAQALSR